MGYFWQRTRVRLLLTDALDVGSSCHGMLRKCFFAPHRRPFQCDSASPPRVDDFQPFASCMLCRTGSCPNYSERRLALLFFTEAHRYRVQAWCDAAPRCSLRAAI